MSAPVYQPLGTLRPTELSPHRKRLSTDEAPAVERFSYWVDLICAIYAQLECDRPADVDVSARLSLASWGRSTLRTLGPMCLESGVPAA